MHTAADFVMEAIAALKLDDAAIVLSEPAISQTIRRVKSTFVSQSDALFWWEHLSVPAVTWQTSNGHRHLEALATQPDAQCLLITGLTDAERAMGVFRCTPQIATRLLDQCPHFEYALVDLALTWMILENHHDIIIASGEAAARLDRLKRARGGPA